MSFPSATPSYPGFTPTHTLSVDQHGEQHNSEQTDIIALANKVGTGASTPTSGVILRGNGTGTSTWTQAQLSTDVTGVLSTANGGTGQSSLTSLPLVSPVITGGGSWTGTPIFTGATMTGTYSGGVYTGATLSQPAIANFTSAQHNHSNAAGGGQLPAGALGTDSSWSWITITPTWTNLTVGNATNNCRYTQIGKTIYFEVELTLGSTSSVSTNVFVNFPVTSISYIQGHQIAVGLGIRSANYQLYGLWDTTARMRLMCGSGSPFQFAQIDANTPATWAAGDVITMHGFYEVP